MTYFVKIPAKYRRQSRKSKYGRESEQLIKLSPVWTFGSEVEAIDFAKSFEICWVDVWHNGKVIFRNYSLEKPTWIIKRQAG